MPRFPKGEIVCGRWLQSLGLNNKLSYKSQSVVALLDVRQVQVECWVAAFPSLDSLQPEPLLETHSWFLYYVINNRRMLWKYVRCQNVLRNIWATEYWSRSWPWSKSQQTYEPLHRGLPCLLHRNCTSMDRARMGRVFRRCSNSVWLWHDGRSSVWSHLDPESISPKPWTVPSLDGHRQVTPWS